VRLDAAVVRLVKIPLRRSFRTSFGELPEKTAVVVELRTSEVPWNAPCQAGAPLALRHPKVPSSSPGICSNIPI
jgi:hypothetical protein